MHATHQFFLTKRSLYIILIDAREGEGCGKLEYWLKTVQKFGDNAPVLVVVNKIDIHPLQLNRRVLQDKYKMIKGFLEISCKDSRGIDQLKEAIQRELAQLEHINDLLLISWFNVKQALEEKLEKKVDYLPYREFSQLCEEKEVPNQSQETLLNLLNDLGTIVYFAKDVHLNTPILNPEWVTTGVYKIILDTALLDAKGILTIPDLRRILPEDRYPVDTHGYIIEMMRKFELCFAFDDDQSTFLIPGLFAESVPPDIEFRQEGLLFNYQYDLLPSSIISRFIVHMKAYLQEGLYWRSGVKLVSLDKDNQALVWADLEQKKIYITVTGKEQGRRYLYFDGLITHLTSLNRQKIIEFWHDGQITPGQEWDKEIKTKLNEADIILMLVSADFMASEYIWEVELTRAVQRHEDKQAIVVPIIIRSVRWQNAPFSKLQALPKEAKPVSSWKDKDAAYVDIVEGLEKLITNKANN
jgi:internalin A